MTKLGETLINFFFKFKYLIKFGIKIILIWANKKHKQLFYKMV